ncbi:MAG: hypothetical protein ACD_39C01909G0003 [uncultured bacterium]|nr:MAG: hypothetical protein ACD_39C01909G0003 [uncultured bacterium]
MNKLADNRCWLYDGQIAGSNIVINSYSHILYSRVRIARAKIERIRRDFKILIADPELNLKGCACLTAINDIVVATVIPDCPGCDICSGQFVCPD